VYHIDLDIERLQMIYEKIDNINILIYEVYETIVNNFFEEKYEEIALL